MDVVRITELQPKTYVEQGDYIAIDNQSDGTKKVQFTNLLDDTLSQENKIAPANVVGDEIATIRAAVGSPLKASTVAQMTDTNKIYVYVGSESGYTNGNWYYWNGSAWTSGGVYNSVAVVTDPTLTLSGVPADAKATGDEVTNLKAEISDISSTTKNLFDPYSVITGVLKDTGAIDSSETDYFTSDYIDVEGKPFTISWDTAPPDAYLRIGLYNSSKVFQSRVLHVIPSGEKSYEVANVNAFSYVKLSCKKGGTKMQVEVNPTATGYVPHFTAEDIKARDMLKASVETAFCPELRNGTLAQTDNAQQVAITQIIPFEDSDSITILIRKPVSASGNYWRVVFDSFNVSTGKPEDNTSHIVKENQIIDGANKIVVYKGFFDTISTGFAFALAEKTSLGGIVAHRIGDFKAGDIVIIRDYACLGERGKYEYFGEKISLNPKYSFRLIGSMPATESSKPIEGIAAYRDKLIALYDTGYYKVFDLKSFTGTALQSGELAGKANSLHCNSCTFGNFYNSGDAFPLLYVTGGTADSVQGYCSVERLDSSYNATHISTISIDYTDFAEFGYTAEHNTPNFYVEGYNLWTFGAKFRTNGSQEDRNNENRFIIHRYELPSTSDANVTLTAYDVLDEFILPYNSFFMQGGTVHLGKLFSLFGCGGAQKGTHNAINTTLVYDLFGGNEIAKMDMSKLTTNTTEPQSLAVHGDDLLINYGDGKLYAVTF